MKQDTNGIEYDKRKEHAQQDENSMDLQIKESKIALKKCQKDLATKEKLREKVKRKRLLDGQQTDYKNNRLKQEIVSLKRKKDDIEKKQSDLPKKQKVNEGLVIFISNAIEDKEKDLECPVCFDTAKAPIYQCFEGHLICKDCLPSLKICPECRTEYPKTPFRNRQDNFHCHVNYHKIVIHYFDRFAEKSDEEIKKLSTERKEMLDGI